MRSDPQKPRRKQMTVKEGVLYTDEKTGTVVMVVKVGYPQTTLSTENGPMKPHESVVSDADLAKAAGQPSVRPGVIVRNEVSLLHELNDESHPITGIKANIHWKPEKNPEK
jgi:hypothetical protein